MRTPHVFMQDQVRNRVAAIMASDPRHPDRRRRLRPGSWMVVLLVGALYSLGVLARV